MSRICSLYWSTRVGTRVERYYLAQVSLESHTHITPVSFDTVLLQQFSNTHDQIIEEARYTFPLYDGVSVYAYTIRYGEKTLTGIVQRKETARKTYQAAVDRGETASLLKSLPAGVFGVTIGNLPAHTDVFVEIRYAGELKHDAGIDGLRYTLPTQIAPRYGDYPGIIQDKNVRASGVKVVLDIDIGGSAIRKIQSPSHPIAVTMGNLSTESTTDPFSPSKGSATLTQGNTELGKDFILQLLIDDISKPQAILERHPELNSRAIMATMVPKFNLPLSTPEIVFIADQSGSMSGSKNAALVAALQIFLKSLPFGVRFNICAFGSKYTYLWAKSQAYNEENLKIATDFVKTLKAQYGGTEMFEPVKAAFERRLGDLPMEIMLLTDGEIWGEHQLFDLINQKIHQDQIDARVFALGIGSDVSHTLVEGVARAGNGFAQFVINNEEIDAKILRMLKASLFPHTKDYTLEVNFDDRPAVEDDFEIIERITNQLHIVESQPESKPDTKPATFFDTSANLDEPIQDETADRFAHLPAIVIPKILQAPSTIPPLFPYNRINLYLMLGADAPTKDVASVTIRAKASTGPLELTMPVHSKDTPATTIHTLAARKAVQDLEEGRGWIHEGKTTDGSTVKQKYESRFDEIVEREAIRLGETFQIAGKWCSFVAVDADTESTTEHTPASKQSSRSILQGTTSSQRRFPSGHGMRFGSDGVGAGLAGNLGAFGAASGMPMGARKRKSGSGLFAAGAPAPRGMMAMASTATTSGSTWRHRRVAPQPQICFDEDLDADEEEDQDMGFGLFDDGGPAPLSAPIAYGAPAAASNDMAFDIQDPGFAPATPTAASVPALPQTPAAVLRRVIDLQTFSGSWQWTAELLALLHADCVDGLAQDDTSATALVLAFIEMKMKAHEDVWEMVAQKAKAWLAAQLPSGQVEQALETAKQRLA